MDYAVTGSDRFHVAKQGNNKRPRKPDYHGIKNKRQSTEIFTKNSYSVLENTDENGANDKNSENNSKKIYPVTCKITAEHTFQTLYKITDKLTLKPTFYNINRENKVQVNVACLNDFRTLTKQLDDLKFG